VNWHYTFYYIYTWLAQWNPVDIMAILLAIGFWLWVWRTADKETNTFDPTDILKDAYTNKASGAALAYLILLGLSVWWIIRETINGGDQSNTLLLILGVFVTKAGADRAISAWGDRKPPMAPDPLVKDADSDAPADVVLPAPVATVDVKTTISAKKGK
jgi:hypothetical protein